MGNRLYEGMGRVWLPERSRSYPGAAAKPIKVNVVVAMIKRPLWSIKGAIPPLPDVQHPLPDAPTVMRRLLEPFVKLVDPKMFLSETIWASITANEREIGRAH